MAERVDRKQFNSNQEYFDTLTGLIASLRETGQSFAAIELEGGYRCLNGLTDGWALLLESIEKVQSDDSNELSQDQRDILDDLGSTARSLVYRR